VGNYHILEEGKKRVQRRLAGGSAMRGTQVAASVAQAATTPFSTPSHQYTAPPPTQQAAQRDGQLANAQSVPAMARPAPAATTLAPSMNHVVPPKAAASQPAAEAPRPPARTDGRLAAEMASGGAPVAPVKQDAAAAKAPPPLQPQRQSGAIALQLPPKTSLEEPFSGMNLGWEQSTVQAPSLQKYFFALPATTNAEQPATQRMHLLDRTVHQSSSGSSGLLGVLTDSAIASAQSGETNASNAEQRGVYLSTTDPFCLVAIGVQGAGKSHSLSVLLENCLINSPPYLRAAAPLTTLVFHYDQDPQNFCEAVSVGQFKPDLPPSPDREGVQQTIVLVSPSYYLKRKTFYSTQPATVVLPLLFKWTDLSAAFIKSLMRVEETDQMPLYMSAILNMLRLFQKKNEMPTLRAFREEIDKMDLMKPQTSGLNQRLSLLGSLVYESDENAFIRDKVSDVGTVLRSVCSGAYRRLVVVDLSDPMFSGPEANGIFEVVLSMFLAASPNGNVARGFSGGDGGALAHVGKAVVFDEAHKYIQPAASDPLSRKLVSVVRQMRHHGVRVAISTQSPLSIPAELLELCSVAMLHTFQSRDWFTYLQSKLPLPSALFDRIMALDTGRALVYARRWPAELKPNLNIDDATYVREVEVRRRITVDAGVSKVHVG